MLVHMMTNTTSSAAAGDATRVSVAEAKRDLARLLRRVEGGERITITRYGRPVATLQATAAQVPSMASLRARVGGEGGALVALLEERARERSDPTPAEEAPASTSTPAS